MGNVICLRAYRIDGLETAAKTELETLYRQSRDAKLRTRVQRVLLSSEQGLKVQQIAEIVRESPSTVLRCLKRYATEGVGGLYEQPRRGRPRKASQAYLNKLIEMRWRHLRRVVTHSEFFLSLNQLVEAATACFADCNQHPHQTLSIIGSYSA